MNAFILRFVELKAFFFVLIVIFILVIEDEDEDEEENDLIPLWSLK